jgi:hypothetical protein
VKNAAKSTERASHSKPDDPTQYERFLEAAREAQADETEKGADKAFKKVTSKPSKQRG